jgi:hypothetical protein
LLEAKEILPLEEDRDLCWGRLSGSTLRMIASKGSRTSSPTERKPKAIIFKPTRKEALPAYERLISSYQIKFPKA